MNAAPIPAARQQTMPIPATRLVRPATPLVPRAPQVQPVQARLQRPGAAVPRAQPVPVPVQVAYVSPRQVRHTLAEAWRPDWITEMVGNKKVLGDVAQRFRDGTMRRAIFTHGPTGCGKTTLNMIIAKHLTCMQPGPDGRPCGTCTSCVVFSDINYKDKHPDILVMNCSENTGIADVRGVLDLARVYPMCGRHRVIFLDEVQGLSKQAEQALLTALEHPPANTAFILGSMHPEQVSKAVFDRCFNIKLGPSDRNSLAARLSQIAIGEGVTLAKEIAFAIADFSECYPRAAVQTLDNVLNRMRTGEPVDLEKVHDMVADVGHMSPFSLAKKALSALYEDKPDHFIEAVSLSDNPMYLLRTMITQNANMIRVAVRPASVTNVFDQRTARDLGAAAAKGGISILVQAQVGRELEETLKLVASYNVDAASALTHTAVLLSSRLRPAAQA
jgi:DNA polymerase III subunit gamma/tau